MAAWSDAPWTHAWVANDAQEADTSKPEEGETITLITNTGTATGDDLDRLEGGDTPVMRLDHFSTGYDGVELSADEGIKIDPATNTIDSSAGVTIGIIFEIGSTTPTGYQPIMYCSDFSDGNTSRHVLFVDGTVLNRRTGIPFDACTGDAASLAVDTPYLVVCYWDGTTAANSYVELDGVDVSPTTDRTSTGHTELDQFAMGWYVNGHDDLTIHSLGIYEGELSAQNLADLETYKTQVEGGGAAHQEPIGITNVVDEQLVSAGAPNATVDAACSPGSGRVALTWTEPTGVV